MNFSIIFTVRPASSIPHTTGTLGRQILTVKLTETFQLHTVACFCASCSITRPTVYLSMVHSYVHLSIDYEPKAKKKPTKKKKKKKKKKHPKPVNMYSSQGVITKYSHNLIKKCNKCSKPMVVLKTEKNIVFLIY